MTNHLSRAWLSITALSLLCFSACSQENNPATNEIPNEVEALAPGNYSRSITIDGTARTYILHVPTGYDGSKSLPLIFMLHGYGGTAQGFSMVSGMSPKADQENFFVAYLDGTKGNGIAQGWNTGLTPGLGLAVDDIAFVRDLAGQLKAELAIDATRVYAAGFSNGGFMSHRLAAELPELLAAVGTVAGTIGVSPDGGVNYYMIPQAEAPIPIVIIHGELDPNIPYYGGQGNGAGQLYVKSVADALAYWTAADGCTEAPQITVNGTGNVTSTDYTGCAEGTEVEHFKISDAYHEWPTVTGTGFSATDAIWEFFSRHNL